MLLDDLEAAIGPAMALLAERLVGVRQQTEAVTLVGVVGDPAILDNGKTEVGVLADGVAGPAAGHVHGGAADQAHGAVNDDGIVLVALDHADVEEAGILAIHDVVHQRLAAVAVILRRLNQADARIGKRRHQVLQPVGRHHIVGVDHADDLGVGRGAGHRDLQRARLEALHLLGIDEHEPLAEHPAMILDRLGEGRVRGVVDDHHALEIRVVQPGHRIQRLLEHFRRLEIGRDMNRDLRIDAVRGRRQAADDQAAGSAAERDGGDLLDPRHGDDDQRHQQDQAQGQRKGRSEHEVMTVPVGEHGGHPGADAIGGCGEHSGLHRGRAVKPYDRQRQQDADKECDGRELPVIGVDHRAGPRELRFT